MQHNNAKATGAANAAGADAPTAVQTPGRAPPGRLAATASVAAVARGPLFTRQSVHGSTVDLVGKGVGGVHGAIAMRDGAVPSTRAISRLMVSDTHTHTHTHAHTHSEAPLHIRARRSGV